MSYFPSVSLLVLGVLIVGAGLVRLDRVDRRRLTSNRQAACRWHQWRVENEGAPLVCALCGKRSGAPTAPRGSDRETPSADTFFFP